MTTGGATHDPRRASTPDDARWSSVRPLVERARDRLRWLVQLPQAEARIRGLEDRVRQLEARALAAEALAEAHHQTRLMANHASVTAARALAIGRHLEEVVDRMAKASFDLERWAAIESVTSWIAAADVPESLTISVVLPTRDRADLLPTAIDSVRGQDYGRWELLVVDDGSTDDTEAVLKDLARSDERITILRGDGISAGAARNRALDELTGDVVVYLDDDNRFHPLWFKAVAWAFTNLPDTTVLYGARLVDDWNRHLDRADRGLPALHFERFDPEAIVHHNQVDMGQIAHRPAPARFDESLHQYGDWDLLLQLTVDQAPLELPVIALYYVSHGPDRLSDVGPDQVEIDHVRRRHAERLGRSR